MFVLIGRLTTCCVRIAVGVGVSLSLWLLLLMSPCRWTDRLDVVVIIIFVVVDKSTWSTSVCHQERILEKSDKVIDRFSSQSMTVRPSSLYKDNGREETRSNGKEENRKRTETD